MDNRINLCSLVYYLAFLFQLMAWCGIFSLSIQMKVCGLTIYAVLLCNWSAFVCALVTDLLATCSVRQLIIMQVLQELDERVQRMNEEHRRDARRRAEELVQPLLAPDFFAQ